MKIKEARERLESLRQLHDSAIKIQNCCLNTLRNFATCVGKLAAGEIKRISDVIDNTDVKID